MIWTYWESEMPKRICLFDEVEGTFMDDGKRAKPGFISGVMFDCGGNHIYDKDSKRPQLGRADSSQNHHIKPWRHEVVGPFILGFKYRGFEYKLYGCDGNFQRYLTVEMAEQALWEVWQKNNELTNWIVVKETKAPLIYCEKFQVKLAA